MNKDYQSKTACVVDNGLFVDVAIQLAKSFGKVYYDRCWVEAFPKVARIKPGQGLEDQGVIRVDNCLEVLHETDLFVFPDLFYAPLQQHLRDLGKLVWGAGDAEELEINRGQFKKLLKRIGLPVGRYALLRGMGELREYLAEHENQYVKASLVRGDIETSFSRDYEMFEMQMDAWEHLLGASKNEVEFISEDALPDCSEIGFDGYTIDGEFPNPAWQGFEVKDAGYFGACRPYGELCKQVRYTNELFREIFKQYGYRGSYHSELRVDVEGQPFYTDITTRCGSPPMASMMIGASNWDDIIYHGAEGILINPEPTGKYLAEAMIHSKWAEEDWQPFYLDEKFQDAFAFKNLAVINGIRYAVAQHVDMPVGSVRAVGDTIEAAYAGVVEAAQHIEGYEIKVQVGALSDAVKLIKQAHDYGIDFTDDPVPDADELNEKND